MALIHEKMVAIMRDCNAIPKNSINQSQGFKFRGIDTIYNELHSVFAKHGVFCMPEVLAERMEDRKSSKGNSLIYRILTIKYKFVAEDGSHDYAVVTGEGMDSGDKAANKAMSIAHKYCLMQALMIATEDLVDPDAESHDSTPPAASGKVVATPTPVSVEPVINQTQYDALIGLIGKAGLNKKQWASWLRPVYGVDTASQIPAAAFAGICEIVKNHPDQIKNFNSAKPVSA
jgi:hypothetical protein